jgi:PAS domain-containing protein
MFFQYYKKVSELKLSLKEHFSLIRLYINISRSLVEKLKRANENCVELENLDVSMYYKYEALSQNFIDEINNDVNLSLEFWNSFRTPLKEPNKKVDFNKVFELTDKIRITKNNIENMWNNLLQIYGGVNDFFQLYMEYIEQINDDDLKKRDLEALKRKNDNLGEHINLNFYSILFSKETGIIIANGDKGSEGIIKLANNEIGNIFKYKPIDLIGNNISILMPKIFATNHSKYIERYFKIGEKKFIDKSAFNSFGKDKNNCIIKIKLALKLFPILNENIYFIALIVRENVDDIILLDDKFDIQGMSLKIMKILNINNKSVFQDNEIPFYVICKKFLNFYNIFLRGKKRYII